MVIFIISFFCIIPNALEKFTFQYGYIYYDFYELYSKEYAEIYIPIWLYLLYVRYFYFVDDIEDLHSNMVIFIILF